MARFLFPLALVVLTAFAFDHGMAGSLEKQACTFDPTASGGWSDGTSCISSFGACKASSDCCLTYNNNNPSETYACTDGKCCQPTGGFCSANCDCCSSKCNSGSCS